MIYQKCFSICVFEPHWWLCTVMHIVSVLPEQLMQIRMAAVCRYGICWGCACIININLAAIPAAGCVHQGLQGRSSW